MIRTFRYTVLKDKSLKVYDRAIMDKEYIIPYPYSQVFLTDEMQRLSDISQNGASRYDFPGLKNNNRLRHSIEAFHMMEKMLDKIDYELKNLGYPTIPDEIRKIALLGISVHDIGHGPGSHLIEAILGKSHEEWTRQILESSDTQINGVLAKILGGKDRISLIESFILGEKENLSTGNIEYDKYLRLISSFTSNLIDADKLAYLQADAFYAQKPLLFSPEEVIGSLSVTLGANGELLPVIKEKGIASVESMRNFRAQMYRDVYFSDSAQIMTYYYPAILKLVQEQLESDIKDDLPPEIKKMIDDPQNIMVKEFLKLTETPVLEAIDYIRDRTKNGKLKYMCNIEELVRSTKLCRSRFKVDDAKKILSGITNKDLSDSDSVFTVNSQIKVRKKKEDFYINYENLGIVSANSEDAEMLLEPKQDTMDKKTFGFNIMVLMEELGINPEEFLRNYAFSLERFSLLLNTKREEFRLSYIIPNDMDKYKAKITDTFRDEGWEYLGETKINCQDSYYDNQEFSVLSRGGTIRIRDSLDKGGMQRKTGTYKALKDKGNAFDIIDRQDVDLEEGSLEEFVNILKKKSKSSDIFDSKLKVALEASTARDEVIFSKGRMRLRVCFDRKHYKNLAAAKILPEDDDNIVQIEIVSSNRDRVSLDEIKRIFNSDSDLRKLQINRQNSYFRGMKKTARKINQNPEPEGR